MTYFPDDKIERRQVNRLFDAQRAYHVRCGRIHRIKMWFDKLYTIQWLWPRHRYCNHVLHFCLRRPWIVYHRGSTCMCEIVRLLKDVYPDKDMP